MNMSVYKALLIAMVGISMSLMSSASEASTRSELLKKTPIGASFDQVWEYCVSEKLKCYQSTSAGYLNQDTGKTIGVMSIWAVVKQHKSTPLTIESTSAYWGFGMDKKLIDLWIWETVDGP